MSTINNLTIAIVTYKRPNYLDKCLKSIFDQKYIPQKIYIIDNDYQKSSEYIYKRYKKIKIIEYFVKPEKNISKARNFALKKCKTQYLSFIDDDCKLSKDWSDTVYEIVKSQSKYAFFQGGVVNKESKNKLVNVQQEIYQKWINSNIKNNGFDPAGLDTKNIILNLEIININKIKFDENLPIFEDIDFGLKIKKYGLNGIFIPELTVKHKELSNLIRILKKNYFRGKIKYILNRKWGNFDNFNPNFFDEIKTIIKEPRKIYEHLLNHFFNIGFLVANFQKFNFSQNKIIIINSFDRGANEERAVALKKYLEENGFAIEFIDSQKEFDKAINDFKNILISPYYFLIYRFLRFFIFHCKFIFLKEYLIYFGIKIRGKIIRKKVILKKVKMVISQYPEDFWMAKKPRPFKVILDIPTLYSEEVKNKGVGSLEKKIFNEGNSTCFHWYSFLKLAKKLGMKPKNSFILNWGCVKQKVFSTYNKKPKIIYLGKLNADWINPKLLKKVQNESLLNVDIYSYESPDKALYGSLKTKGFMKNINNISDYQFGLLSFTDDQLRNNGFSAKHLAYISYGMPVLCPEWRKDKLLEPATIYYNEENFNQQIKKYSQKKYWDKKHVAALKLAKKLDWNETLKPILPVIYKLQSEI